MPLVTSPTRDWPAAILRFLGFTVLVTAAVALVSPALNAPLSPLNLGVFFLFAAIISGLSWLVMPRLGAYTEGKHPLLRWTVLIAALLGTGTVGTAIAAAIGYYGFSLNRDLTPLGLFGRALPVALAVTVTVGVITTWIAAGRDRLEKTRAALEAQRFERERAEKLAAEARLASLASRVQPHFLFNTLNSVAALIREDPAQAEQTIERLSSLLRSSLDQTETVPLEQELNLVRDYLAIQKTRHGSRLSYEISTAPGLAAAVPPFAVQTLVENSIKHVAGSRPEGVGLKIRTAPAGNAAIVFVTDNGPGFDPTSIPQGHGLDNLQGRLRAACGADAGLEFLREPGHMTVRVRVPLKGAG